MKATGTGLHHSHRACGRPWRNAWQPTGRTGHPSSQGLSRARLPAAHAGQPCPEVGPCSGTPPAGLHWAGGGTAPSWVAAVTCQLGDGRATALRELPRDQSSVVGDQTWMWSQGLSVLPRRKRPPLAGPLCPGLGALCLECWLSAACPSPAAQPLGAIAQVSVPPCHPHSAGRSWAQGPV